MAKSGWKVVAIIFIILFIVETVGIIWIFKIGNDSINKENECAMDICQMGSTYNSFDAYQYDSMNNMCYCYKNREILKSKYMGND